MREVGGEQNDSSTIKKEFLIKGLNGVDSFDSEDGQGFEQVLQVLNRFDALDFPVTCEKKKHSSYDQKLC